MKLASNIPKFPLYKNFKATTISKAFVLNAIVAALVAAITIQFREFLDDMKKEEVLSNPLLWSDKGILSGYIKTFYSFVVALGVTLFTYLMLYVLFGFGGGMLVCS